MIAQEEIFGPVVAVMKAADLDEALAIANGVRYALTGGLISRSPAAIARVRREFRVGNLYINRGITGALVERQAFGGFKMSGVGSKAGGPDYLLQFLEPRVITENTLRRGFAPPDDLLEQPPPADEQAPARRTARSEPHASSRRLTANERPSGRGGAAKEEEAMTRKVKIVIAVPLALVAVLALFAVVGLVSRRRDSADSDRRHRRRGHDVRGAGPPRQSVPEPVMGADAGTAAKSTSGGAADGQDFAAAVPPASAPSAHYLLRTGDLSLLVERGALLPTVDRIKSMTTAMGGYVMSSAVGSQAARAGRADAARRAGRVRRRASRELGHRPRATPTPRSSCASPSSSSRPPSSASPSSATSRASRRPARTSPPSTSTCRRGCVTTAPSSAGWSGSSRRRPPSTRCWPCRTASTRCS